MPFQVLGEGSFGVVIKSKDRIHAKIAIKVIPFWKSDEKCSEAEIGQRISLGHKNLLTYLDYKRCDNESETSTYRKLIKKRLLKECSLKGSPTGFFLVQTEYCNGGSLQDWITSVENPQRNKEMAEYLFSQIVQGVVYISGKSIVHGDLKPHNILLQYFNGDVIIKICNFGNAFDTSRKAENKLHCGTDLYQEKNFDIKSRASPSYDVYSLGSIYVIVFISAYGNFDQCLTSTKEMRKNSLQSLLVSVQNSGEFQWIMETHPERARLINKMLSEKGEERPSAYEVNSLFSNILKNTPQRFSKCCPIPGKNPLFLGRVEQLEVLHSLKNKTNEGSKFILLHGMSGTGKKSIVAEFLNSKGESYEFQKSIWFRADSRRALENKYFEFKKEIKSKLKLDALTKVKNYLENSPGLIIVYENVCNFKELEDLLPSLAFNKLMVICTSRTNSQDWPDYFQKIQVGPLALEDCTKLILDSLRLLTSDPNDQLSKTDAEDLSRQMGCLPTAICQSLAFIKSEYNTKIRTIPTFLEFHQENLQKFKKVQKLPISTTLLSTLYQIKSVSKAAFEWIKICAYLDHENIPEFIFHEFYQQQGEDCSKAELLRILDSFSIVTHTGIGNSIEFFAISHFVQEILRIQFYSCFENTMEMIFNILKKVSPFKRNTTKRPFGSVIKMQQITPHYECVVNHIQKYVERKGQSGNSLKSLTCCGVPNKINSLLVLLNTEFSLINKLKFFYKSLSFREKEKNLLERLLQLKETLFGEDSLIRGTTLMENGKHDLSTALKLKTKRAEFEKHLKSSISWLKDAAIVLKQCYDNNYKRTDIFQCYLHLGECFMSKVADSKCAGRQQCDSSLEAQINCPKCGNLSKSIEYFQKSLTILVELVQKEMKVFQRIGYTLRKIATVNKRLGNDKLTENYLLLGFEFFLLNCPEGQQDKCTEVLPQLLKRLTNIEAEEVTDEKYKNTLEKWTLHPKDTSSILKDFTDHYKTINRERSNLAKMFRLKCKTADLPGRHYEDEMVLPLSLKTGADTEFIKSFVNKMEKDKEVSKVELANKKILLARRLKLDGEYSEAILIYEQALEILLKNFNPKDDLNIAFIYEKMGECYSIRGDKGSACQMYKKCYDIEKSNGSFAQDKNEGFAQLIQKYVKVLPDNELKKKIELLKESLPILVKCFGENKNVVGMANEKLGGLLLENGNSVDAKEYLKEARRIFERNLPKGNQNRISCLKKLLKTFEMAQRRDRSSPWEGIPSSLEMPKQDHLYPNEVNSLKEQIEEEQNNPEIYTKKPTSKKVKRNQRLQEIRRSNQRCFPNNQNH